LRLGVDLQTKFSTAGLSDSHGFYTEARAVSCRPVWNIFDLRFAVFDLKTGRAFPSANQKSKIANQKWLNQFDLNPVKRVRSGGREAGAGGHFPGVFAGAGGGTGVV
jgi:hypothetical protein